jgi:hypothetical protein
MKTKAHGIPKAFDPYSQEEITLILTLPPTNQSIRILAKSLGRSEEAIKAIYKLAYSGKWLKNSVARIGGRHNVFDKIGAAKKELGIVIGHRP